MDIMARHGIADATMLSICFSPGHRLGLTSVAISPMLQFNFTVVMIRNTSRREENIVSLYPKWTCQRPINVHLEEQKYQPSVSQQMLKAPDSVIQRATATALIVLLLHQADL